MKKIFVLLTAVFMLAGCSQGKAAEEGLSAQSFVNKDGAYCFDGFDWSMDVAAVEKELGASFEGEPLEQGEALVYTSGEKATLNGMALERKFEFQKDTLSGIIHTVESPTEEGYNTLVSAFTKEYGEPTDTLDNKSEVMGEATQSKGVRWDKDKTTLQIMLSMRGEQMNLIIGTAEIPA